MGPEEDDEDEDDMDIGTSPLRSRSKGLGTCLIKAARKGTCKQGERSDLTGCTPASGEASARKRPAAKPKPEAPRETPKGEEPHPDAVKAAAALKQMMGMGVGLGLDVFVPGGEAKYRSPIKYVEDLGTDWHGSPLPKGVERGTPKECYRNASMLVMYDSNLDYAEGFFMAPGLLPIYHAWAVTKDGKVIDNTVSEPERNAYRGIVYPREKYLKMIYKAKMYGVLGGDDKTAVKVLKNGGL